MKLKNLSVAMILATVPMTGAFAAAMDRSGQSISAFLQPGNYAEAGISVLDADVSGTTALSAPVPATAQVQDTGDMAKSYYFPTAALKLQLNDKFSVGLLYDQPFGANAEYKKSAGFTDNGKNTSVEVHTQSLSLILGYQPTANWNIYAGPVYQEVRGDVELHGFTYGGSTSPGLGGYKAQIDRTGDFGWLVGAAYQIPEIALKASITYRSEIKHDTKILETSSGSGAAAQGIIAYGKGTDNTEITTPQSINLDFQTGVAADTVAFANIRWVNWKDFSIQPYAFGKVTTSTQKPEGIDLVAYSKDQWSANVGVGRKLSDKWGANVSVGWDSGAGNPVTTLGPTEGYWNLGIGAQYSPAANYFVQAGVKYFWLGDAKAQSGADFGTNKYAAEFKDNHAIGYGLKFGYKF